MKESLHSVVQVGSGVARSRKRLNTIFAVLAVLNIVTALGALAIGQMTLFMLQRQETESADWNVRIEKLMTLRDAINLLSLPASSVFETGDVEKERGQLAAAEAGFGQALSDVQGSFASVIEGREYTAPVAKRLQELDVLASEMAMRTHVVLDFFAQGRQADAAREMAGFGSESIKKSSAITGILRHVIDGQASQVEYIRNRVNQLQAAEGIFAGLLVILLFGSFVYSRSADRQWRRSDLQRSLYVSDLEAHRLQLQEKISQISAAHRELEAAKLAAEQASAAKSMFLANMSHEIRTPLNGVIGMIDILLDSTLHQEQRVHAETARASADQLLHVIGNILDISKLEENSLTLESVPFQVVPAVESAVQTFAAKAHAKGVEICVEIDACADGTFKGDPTRLRQVLLNLVGNAVKFTDHGVVRVTVDASEMEGDLRRLDFTISDTGIGMTAQAKAKLFEKFAQGDESITRRFGGTGLGLAICREIVTAMGGEITAESTEGEGSTFGFSIVLPALPAQHLPDEATCFAGKRALVVDDLALNREILVRRLSRWGMTADAVQDGLSAIIAVDNAARSGAPYDIIFLDRHMPGQDGQQVAEAIRTLECGSGARLALCSSISHGVTVSAGANTVFDAVLFKPLIQTALLETLASLLRPEGTGARHVPRASAASFAGTRILLVEDNETNRLAATTMLSQLGCEVETSVNGLEAVSAASQKPFDLVLMDMQMPELDGLEATRRIRAGTGPNRNVPILALTANAFVEDARRCREAGMNEHLTKPVRRHMLEAALRRHLVASQSQTPEPHTPETQAPVQQPADPIVTGGEVKRGAIDEQTWAELLSDMPESAVRRLADTFVASQARELQAMHEDLQSGNLADFRRRAHTLKGAAMLLGAGSLAGAAAALEAEASQAIPDSGTEKLAEIERHFETAAADLSARLAALTSAA
jgi:signal transduction histidine kinase/CheY-like chemotaxis protein/HPt (histidine-containing phosphotransfer) domain-containing protein